MCADMWSMACFLWTAPNGVAPAADRSKRGRAWAREAASLLETDPVKLEQEMRVFKMAWESKRQTAYARWVRADWSTTQWWVEQKKEDATRNRSKQKAEDSTGTEGETDNLPSPGVSRPAVGWPLGGRAAARRTTGCGPAGGGVSDGRQPGANKMKRT